MAPPAPVRQAFAESADDAQSGLHRVAGPAEGQHQLADAQIGVLDPCRRREVGAGSAEQCQVGGWIAADERGRDLAAVRQADRDFIVALDNVMRGHDQAVGRPDDAGRRHALAGIDPHDALAGGLDCGGQAVGES